MNLNYVHPVVNALLYDGFKLYPTPAAAARRPRWTVGSLYPHAYVSASTGADTSGQETQCLWVGDPRTRLEIRVRFLHTLIREIGTLTAPARGWPDDPDAPEPAFRFGAGQHGEAGALGDDEAVERDLQVADLCLGDLLGRTHYHTFSFPAWRSLEALRDAEGEPVGVIVRHQKPVQGRVSVTVQAFSDRIFHISVRVENRTPVTRAIIRDRERAAHQAFASTHTLLETRGGEFVSLMAPPEELAAYTMLCENRGTFPVLVGPEGHNRTVLSSPVILHDHPKLSLE